MKNQPRRPAYFDPATLPFIRYLPRSGFVQQMVEGNHARIERRDSPASSNAEQAEIIVFSASPRECMSQSPADSLHNP
jgi:hypothetical protein